MPQHSQVKPKFWSLRSGVLLLDHPQVMGILNITPDSFSDGGSYFKVDAAVERGLQIEEEGASILDIGAESTRPTSAPLDAEEEWQRLRPVLEILCKQIKIPISIDTYHAATASRALDFGVELINDISGAQSLDLLKIVANSSAAYIAMHMRGTPQTMMGHSVYRHVVNQVKDELEEIIKKAMVAGIQKEKICLDPGFGFAKTTEQNDTLFEHLEDFANLEFPLLVGISRKKMLRDRVGSDTDILKTASITGAVEAVKKGAHIVRVHDVKETKMALEKNGDIHGTKIIWD